MLRSPELERALADLYEHIVVLREAERSAREGSEGGLRSEINLNNRFAKNIEDGGVIAELFEYSLQQNPTVWPWNPITVAIHVLALRDKAPEVRRFLPQAGGTPASTVAEFDEQAAAYLETAQRRTPEILEHLKRGVQSNYPHRGSLLFPVEILAALEARQQEGEEQQQPVTVLSVGASGGIELRAHNYQHPLDGTTYGNPDAKTVLEGWSCASENLAHVHKLLGDGSKKLIVEELRGCDLAPIDLTTEHGQTLYLAYYAAVERDESTDAGHNCAISLNALGDAREIPVPIDEEDLLKWLPAQLARNRQGRTTIVWASAVKSWLTEKQRGQLDRICREAGRQSTEDSPLYYAHFSFEGTKGVYDMPLNVESWSGNGRHREFSVRTKGSDGWPVLPLDEFFAAAGVLPLNSPRGRGIRRRP